MISLAHLLAEGRRPDHPVAWVGPRRVDWSEFSRRVATLAGSLGRHEARESWLVALDAPLEFAVALFALWQAGKRAVLAPSLRPGALEDAAAKVDAVLDEQSMGELGDAPDPASSQRLRPLAADQCRLDLFTSGSTGEPKRVAKTLAQLDAEVAVQDALWKGGSGPVYATVPHYHIYGMLFRILWPLAAGRPFDTETCSAPEILLARMGQFGPGDVISSPSQLSRLPDLIPIDSLDDQALRIFSSGGPLPAGTALQFQNALGEAPVEIYGSTETGGIAWRVQRDGDDAWTPLPGIRLSITDAEALVLESPFLPTPAPLTLDDAGVILSDARFRLLGRLDRIVKIEGKRLSLAEMEARLRNHSDVLDAVVAVLPGRRQTIGAALVLNEAGRARLDGDGRRLYAEGLRAYLAPWFDPVLLPRHWRYPGTLPYNERGKLTAAELACLFDPKAKFDA